MDLEDPKGSEPGYRHPHVVIQNNVFNKSKINTVVVCAITSNLKRATAPGNIALRKGEGNLPKDSVDNISQVVTLNKSDLVEKIGSLPPKKIQQIVDGIKLLMATGVSAGSTTIKAITGGMSGTATLTVQ